MKAAASSASAFRQSLILSFIAPNNLRRLDSVFCEHRIVLLEIWRDRWILGGFSEIKS
jgi:hypothetical protein